LLRSRANGFLHLVMPRRARSVVALYNNHRAKMNLT